VDLNYDLSVYVIIYQIVRMARMTGLELLDTKWIDIMYSNYGFGEILYHTCPV